jgi:hypothetical protein
MAASLGAGQARRANINLAEARFRLGEFAQAEEMATVVLEAEPENFRAIMLQARLALLRNQLTHTEALAQRALELRPTHRQPSEVLSEVHSRRGEFAQAAAIQLVLKKEISARRLADLETRSPYTAKPARARIPFAEIDPAPILEVSLNGGPKAAFLLDTATAEVAVEAAWSTENGLVEYGIEKMPGGLSRTWGLAESLALDGMTIRDVPVTLLAEPLHRTTTVGTPIRGRIGTTLLSRFLATIDHPAGQLVLAPRRATAAEVTDPTLLARIPFYFTPENDILVRGHVNDGDRILLQLASGTAGLGFTSPRNTLDNAHVDLLAGSESGSPAIPYLLDSLSLGALERTQVPGVHGFFPAELEHSRGFQIGGLLGHGFIRPYAVTLDFDAMELLIRQPVD